MGLNIETRLITEIPNYLWNEDNLLWKTVLRFLKITAFKRSVPLCEDCQNLNGFFYVRP